MYRLSVIKSQRMSGSQPHERKGGYSREKTSLCSGREDGMRSKNGKPEKTTVVLYD